MTATADSQPARILLVDDEPKITAALCRLLAKEPFEVVAANSVDEAFDLMAEKEFDVVVSDEQMPRMTGSEFLGALRRAYPHTVRILLTGNASLDTAIQAVNRAGIFRFLRKPWQPQEFIESLHAALAHRAERAHAPMVTMFPAADGMSIDLSSRFERALAGLWMAVQPVVAVPGRDVFAYECLVRSKDPSIPHGGAFVELAERLSRTQELDRTIRRYVAGMLDGSAGALTVLVNLHPTSLDDPDLYDPEAPLSQHASRVVLELTERASLHDMNGAREKVNALRALGYRIAVDDLGAGYAGLTSLALLHPEIVKLDMELVRGIHASPTKAKLVAAVITLCRELGAHVIAEGIETIDEFRTLESLGCGLLQGYYFARPGPPYPVVNWPS